MCMGLPMQVIEMRGTHALCEADGQTELIDMILVGEQTQGTWILNFLGAAREVLSPAYAEQMRQALSALSLIHQSELPSSQQLDALFADLIGREPPLPEHLRAQLPPKG